MSGVASAAMPCCSGSGMSKMQMGNGKSDIPCHQNSTKKNDTKNHNSCEKCKNCVATSALMPGQENNSVPFTNVNHNESVSGFVSHEPSGIYSPPKHTS